LTSLNDIFQTVFEFNYKVIQGRFSKPYWHSISCAKLDTVGKKGRLEVGELADLVLLDATEKAFNKNKTIA
jgi:hypothetical protein